MTDQRSFTDTAGALADEFTQWVEKYAAKVCPPGCLPLPAQEREINLFARMVIALRGAAQAEIGCDDIVLVPREPTPEMIAAARVAIAGDASALYRSEDESIGCFYRAMICAAAQAEQKPPHLTVQNMAETIHKARWPVDRQTEITPFEDEDRNDGGQVMKPAKGTEGINGERAIAIRFDDLTFDEISREAQQNHRSFSGQVRHYVALGRKACAVPSTPRGGEA